MYNSLSDAVLLRCQSKELRVCHVLSIRRNLGGGSFDWILEVLEESKVIRGKPAFHIIEIENIA